MKRYNLFILVLVVLSIVSLFLEQIAEKGVALLVFTNTIDSLLALILLIETALPIIKTKYKKLYVKTNWASIVFTVLIVSSFVYSKLSFSSLIASNWVIVVLFFRNLIVGLKFYARMKSLSTYIERFTANPAQSILLSFVFLILAGTLLLMMPFSTFDEKGISFIDALFTATSASCVTGLIVQSTAGTFTVFGQIVLMLLMQTGGLGIMLLSFFMVFLLGKKISLQDKMLLSYMLSEDDSSNLRSTVFAIVSITFILEGVGGILLFIGFAPTLGFSVKNFYYSIFHSVSAFCNAGFSLYDESLESFRLNPLIILTIGFLIIFGGIGFSVIKEVKQVIKERAAHFIKKTQSAYKYYLSLNTRVVLTLTGALIIGGTLLFYLFEHGNSMAKYGLAEQYLSAFFQSVTLRTAGFNSVPFSGFALPTYAFMCLFMFVGGASGGTAGGMKVGILSILYATARAFFKGEERVVINRFQVSENKIKSAAIIFIAGILTVTTAIFILSITEKQNFIYIVFEVFSAIATVGLSAGITSSLTLVGKTVIILLMFFGRLGALTIMTAAVFNKDRVNINLPQADILIG